MTSSLIRASTLVGLAGLVGLFGLGQPANSGDLLIYDENASARFSYLQWVHEDSVAAHGGAAGLVVTQTIHNMPMLRLAAGRTDMRPYGILEFYVRAAEATSDPVIFMLDITAGTHLRVASYVEGGVIDTQWRKAEIPVEDLASAEFALDTVFLIAFEPARNPSNFYLDDIVLRDVRRPRVVGWSTPSARVVSLRLDVLDHAALPSASAFTVQSATDPDFVLPTAPIAVGSDRAAVGVSDAGLKAEVESRVHLLLPYPLKDGHSYRIDLSGLRGTSGLGLAEPETTVAFDAERVSASIKVNQVGYQPAATKIGFVGNWLGDLGPMPVDTAGFRVVRAGTDETVLSGQLRLRIANDPRSGEDVYEADFTALSSPGSYRLAVDGIGRSHPFEIAADIYDDVYRTTMRLFYHKRNTDLTAPFADPGYERAGIDPLLDAVFHPVLATYPLTRGETPFAYRSIAKGWYDAGDYGHYMHNAAPVWPVLALAMDLAGPGHFRDGELGIPESGNGIPDILDELHWGMQWALSMQDDDGGVYWRMSSGVWDMGLPEDVSEPRFIYEKTTRATAQFAAMAAIYSRLMRPYRPADAEQALSAALQAWDFVMTHDLWPPEGTLYENPAEHPGGGTYPASSSLPDIWWAAAELYRVTGDERCQDAYRTLLPEIRMDLTAAPSSTWGFWALLNAGHDNRDVLLVESARRSIMVAADIKRSRSAGAPYRSAKHPHIPYTGWFTFSTSPIDALALYQAHHLSGEPAYADHATQLLDIILGANPQSKVYLTGIGDDPVRDPMDRISLNDANPEPLRGMTVAGPTWHLPGFREPYISVNAAYLPPAAPATENDYYSAYPVLRRWIDDHQLIPMNESTVREWAHVAAAFGLARNAASPPTVMDPAYPWTPGASTQTGIYRLGDIPVADVPLIRPHQITALGTSALDGSAAHIAALTAEQVAAINAPAAPYWVGRLSMEQRLALTAEQIAAFEHGTQLTPLPPELVPLIPPASMVLIGTRLAETSAAWKAAVTAAQFAAMTADQQAIMLAAGYTVPTDNSGGTDGDGDSDAGTGGDTDTGGDDGRDDASGGTDDDQAAGGGKAKRPPGCDRRSDRADQAPGANPCDDRDDPPGKRKGQDKDQDKGK